jgi:hypothetical protein
MQVGLELTFQAYIWEVLGSNLSWDTSYLDRFFILFHSSLRQIHALGHDCFLPDPFHFIIHDSTYLPVL